MFSCIDDFNFLFFFKSQISVKVFIENAYLLFYLLHNGLKKYFSLYF